MSLFNQFDLVLATFKKKKSSCYSLCFSFISYPAFVWIAVLHVDSLVVYHIIVDVMHVPPIAAMVAVRNGAVQHILLRERHKLVVGQRVGSF